MKLYATPLSHFSRKARILLDLYGVPYEFVDVGNVAEGDQAKFADNPLMKVPVLVDDGEWVIESDHVAGYIVSKVDPSDRYRVHTRNLADLNVRAVLNGIMSEEVKVILARRTGVPTGDYSFFDDALESIRNGFSWLEDRAATFDPSRPTYREFHLVCAWQHIEYYDLVPLPRARLRAIVDELLSIPELRKTSPALLRPKAFA